MSRSDSVDTEVDRTSSKRRSPGQYDTDREQEDVGAEQRESTDQLCTYVSANGGIHANHTARDEVARRVHEPPSRSKIQATLRR